MKRMICLLACLALACALPACATGGVEMRPKGETVIGGSVGKNL